MSHKTINNKDPVFHARESSYFTVFHFLLKKLILFSRQAHKLPRPRVPKSSFRETLQFQTSLFFIFFVLFILLQLGGENCSRAPRAERARSLVDLKRAHFLAQVKQHSPSLAHLSYSPEKKSFSK